MTHGVYGPLKLIHIFWCILCPTLVTFFFKSVGLHVFNCFFRHVTIKIFVSDQEQFWSRLAQFPRYDDLKVLSIFS